jgi:hypothetical protein
VIVSSDSPSAAHARLGEVIETSTLGFTAESDQLHILPELGALVRVGSVDEQRSFYGIVAFGETGGLDTSRKAVRRGGDDVADAAIYARHPELEYVLRTVFSVAVLGFRDGGTYRHYLPTLPVPLHYSVHRCGAEEVAAFCNDPRYLPTILNYRGELLPEAILASHLRWVDQTIDDRHVWLRDAVRRLARLMKRDYDRFVTVMQTIDPD